MSTNTDFKRVEAILYNYSTLKAEIKNMKLDLEILENDYEGIGAISYEEKTGPTNKINSSVENEIIRRDEKIIQLRKKIRYKDIQIEKIDNILELLSEKEQLYVQLKYMKKHKGMQISDSLDMSYSNGEMMRRGIVAKLSKNILNSY